MKYLAKLPNKRFYKAIPSNKPDVWLWEDIETSALKIAAPMPNPWHQQCLVLSSKQKQRGDARDYPYRLLLRLKPLESDSVVHGIIPEVRIERKNLKGIFAWSSYQPVEFYAFPVSDKIWVFYSFYSV